MKIYLVGGYVRDGLLGLSPKDKDYIVVGATPEDMLKEGYTKVGKDFPVFLHSESKDEYALARRERSTGLDTHSFDMDIGSDVTLEEDLFRRDLTINAMAISKDGKITDPYNGRSDLKNKILRHVSPHFSEDPLRVLRLARFYARYAHLGFKVADETKILVKAIERSGALTTLDPQRLFKELKGALGEKSPHAFFELLDECDALQTLFPEVHALKGVPQPKAHHPEIDTFVHQIMVLEQSAKHEDALVNFMALTHDFGKAMTPKEEWPKHHRHEELGLPVIESFCERLHTPNRWRDMSLKMSKYHTNIHRALELNAKSLVKLFDVFGAFKKTEDFNFFLNACEADARGRLGFEEREYPQKAYLEEISCHLYKFSYDNARLMKEEPSKRGEFLRCERCSFVNEIMQGIKNPEKTASVISVMAKHPSELLPDDIKHLNETLKLGNNTDRLKRFTLIYGDSINHDCVAKLSSLSEILVLKKERLLENTTLKGADISKKLQKDRQDVIDEFKF